MATVSLLSSNGVVLDSLVFPEFLAKHFESHLEKYDLKISGEPRPFERFERGMLEDLRAIMELCNKNPETWDLIASNIGVKDKKPLKFDLKKEFVELCDAITKSRPEPRTLTWLFAVGNIALSLETQGVPAIIGQYIADRIAPMSAQQMNEVFQAGVALPSLEEQERLKQNIPKFSEILRAVEEYFPDSEIIEPNRQLLLDPANGYD